MKLVSTFREPVERTYSGAMRVSKKQRPILSAQFDRILDAYPELVPRTRLLGPATASPEGTTSEDTIYNKNIENLKKFWTKVDLSSHLWPYVFDIQVTAELSVLISVLEYLTHPYSSPRPWSYRLN